MKRIFKLRNLMIMVLFTGVFAIATAQSPVKITPPPPYYIDVNETTRPDVYKIHDGIMGLRYNDRYGVASEIQLNLYDWKYNLAAQFKLDKTPGHNQYTVDLGGSLAIEKEKNYFCTFTDEAGNKYEWVIMLVDKPVTDLQANIIVNPRALSCKDLEENLVEFYGEIIDGRAPYSVSWYVLNSEKSDFLYQPRQEQVHEHGRTSMIKVDRKPAYNVMLEVTDACGNNVKKMVYLTCGDKKKKVNTIFVEPVRQINSQGIKGTN